MKCLVEVCNQQYTQTDGDAPRLCGLHGALWRESNEAVRWKYWVDACEPKNAAVAFRDFVTRVSAEERNVAEAAAAKATTSAKEK